jgi:glucose-6-phosphate isomerase
MTGLDRERSAGTTTLHVGALAQAYDRTLASFRQSRLVARLWSGDDTLWQPEADDVANRLGWLHSPDRMRHALPEIEAFARRVGDAGPRCVLLLGMGGSSLAPEVFANVFGAAAGHPSLHVVDTTDPDAVAARAADLDPRRTFFLVASKSGTTVETLSLFRFFYRRMVGEIGTAEAGRHFAAITDPGTPLQDIAGECQFLATFLNDPEVGGRYSALTHFGLVPAALLGVDLRLLLDRAAGARDALRAAAEGQGPPEEMPEGVCLGAALGVAARSGRDKLTLVTSPTVSAFGDWVEQLVAESTGKQGVGILPVVGEPARDPADYGADRFFVFETLAGEAAGTPSPAVLAGAGQPVVARTLGDRHDLGAAFYHWAVATAVAGHVMGINPFDQPDVESAKRRARELVERFREEGALAEPLPSLREDGLAVYGAPGAGGLASAIRSLVEEAPDGAYVALQAYLPPGPAVDEALAELAAAVRMRAGVPVTVGYGPRYLHSTGQLHKGDAGRGRFLQLTAEPAADIGIPNAAGEDGVALTFGVLERAQALGDFRALEEAGRRVVRVHLGPDAVGGLERLATALDGGRSGAHRAIR